MRVTFKHYIAYLIAAIWSLSAMQAHAIEKDLSFKTLTIGKKTSIAAVQNIFEKQAYTFSSCYPSDNIHSFNCLGDVKVGQYLATASVDVRDDEVEQISVMFHKNFYVEIRDALFEKYGSPEKHDIDTVKNGFGAEFSKENSYWSNLSSDNIYLTSVFGKIDQSGFIMSTKKYRDRQASARKLKNGDL